jgi:hypothetical protein
MEIHPAAQKQVFTAEGKADDDCMCPPNRKGEEVSRVADNIPQSVVSWKVRPIVTQPAEPMQKVSWIGKRIATVNNRIFFCASISRTKMMLSLKLGLGKFGLARRNLFAGFPPTSISHLLLLQPSCSIFLPLSEVSFAKQSYAKKLHYACNFFASDSAAGPFPSWPSGGTEYGYGQSSQLLYRISHIRYLKI